MLNRLPKLKEIDTQEKSMLPAGLGSDKKLVVETCQSGPCLQSIQGKNLPMLLKDLLQVKARFGRMSTPPSIMGSSKMKPAPSCTFMKVIFDIKINGFMWIKNQCSKKPFKTYCMNNIPNPRGYLIETNHEFSGINVSKALKIGKPEEFIKVCEKPGFEVARINSLSDIETIAFLALEYGFTYHNNGGLLIG